MQGFLHGTIRLYQQSPASDPDIASTELAPHPRRDDLCAGAGSSSPHLLAQLGIIGGLILGAVNALIIGSTLSLTEEAIRGGRRMQWHNIPSKYGAILLGGDFCRVSWCTSRYSFSKWALQANPYGPLIATAVFFLMFVLLNPVPEVIYQSRKGSALEIVQESYEFVLGKLD